MIPVDPLRGRGTSANPPNRFVPIHYEPAPRDLDDPAPRTQVFEDHSRSIIASNDSPDVHFTHSLNPYRGCEHGCVYCYARPTHEYLGLSAGLDFETKIIAKPNAAQLLRRELSAKSWKPTMLALSGVTDPYQPVERELCITRQCLEVLAEFRNPVGVVTKSRLITRDADLLADLTKHRAASAVISVTTLDPDLARKLEPRATTPAGRLEAIRTLAAAGIPVGVFTAPVIPGMTDHEIPSILAAAREAGARFAGMVVLRLPFCIGGMFDQWLQAHYPERKARVFSRIAELRGGDQNDSRFGTRMTGEGPIAQAIRNLFVLHRDRLGLGSRGPDLSTAHFRVPGPRTLFDDVDD